MKRFIGCECFCKALQFVFKASSASEQRNKCKKTGLCVCVSWVEITCVGTAESVFCQCTEIWPAPVVRHTQRGTHTPDENQSTARPASSDVPTPVPFINIQLKAAGPGPDAGPTRLNSTRTKQTH
ncbi:hypothetical protein GOODEAATRI_012293 [Goodea atripinnis]|uniref:Uncharacterized protein n=1 Tax=Goodea atripinnis TaxID=208336 RepID=A0ABV0N0R1_9TELE